jgi:hypothetical protein
VFYDKNVVVHTIQPHSRSVVVAEQQENCRLRVVDDEHNNKAAMNHPLNSIIDVGTAFLPVLGKDLSILEKDDDTITTTPDSSFEWSHSSQPGSQWTKSISSALTGAWFQQEQTAGSVPQEPNSTIKLENAENDDAVPPCRVAIDDYRERLAQTQVLLSNLNVENHQQQSQLIDMGQCLQTLSENYKQASEQQDVARERIWALEQENCTLECDNRKLQDQYIILQQNQKASRRPREESSPASSNNNLVLAEEQSEHLQQETQTTKQELGAAHRRIQMLEGAWKDSRTTHNNSTEDSRTTHNNSTEWLLTENEGLLGTVKESRATISLLETKLEEQETTAHAAQVALHAKLHDYHHKTVVIRREMLAAQQLLATMSSESHLVRTADKQHEANLSQAHARTEVLREQLDRCLLLLAKRSAQYGQSKTLVQSLEEERVQVRLLEQEVSHLGTECEALRTEATERRDENGVLRLQIIQLEHDKGSSESKLRQELEHCVAWNETLRVQLDETRGKLQSKEEGEHRLRNEYRSTMLREEERSAELEGRNRRLETKMGHLRCEQKSLQTNYSQAQTSMDELLASIMNLKQDKAQLEEEAKTSHKSQSLLHETMHELEAKLKQLKQSNASLRKDLAQTNRARRGANESIVQLESRIHGMENTTAGLIVDRRGLETELYGLQETIDHMILHC